VRELVRDDRDWLGYAVMMDLDALARSWQHRLTAEAEQRRALAAQTRAAAARAARVLRAEFDVSEVWLFGSLVDGPRHDDFDVDLAVAGLAPARFFAALARVSAIVGRNVDLVTLETCAESLKQRVRERGVRVDV
jgi:predicted nucleotidyltransferase